MPPPPHSTSSQSQSQPQSHSQSQARSQPASQTQTVPRSSTSAPQNSVVGTLILRGEPRARSRRRIRWAEDVIDNEGMGKKSSKVCCIYHPTREFGESSSESDSASSSSSDNDSDDIDGGRTRKATSAKMGGKGKSKRPSTKGGHNHAHNDGHDHGLVPSDRGVVESPLQPGRSHSPNAYEKIPKPKMKKIMGGATVTELAT